jgi:hypothetical protein
MILLATTWNSREPLQKTGLPIYPSDLWLVFLLLEEILKDPFSSSRVCLLIRTHGHVDALKRSFGPTIAKAGERCQFHVLDDINDVDGLERAMNGVHTVLYTVRPLTSIGVAAGTAVVEAAVKAGVSHFILNTHLRTPTTASLEEFEARADA